MEYRQPQSYLWKEHIRMRPGMYIGSTHLNGFKQMLEYLFEEFSAYKSAAPIFEIGFYPGNRVTLRVTGIRTEEFALRISGIEKTESPNTQLALCVPVALSSDICITVNNASKAIVLLAKQGDYQFTHEPAHTQENNVAIDFTIDAEIFKELKLEYEQVNVFLKQFAYLNPELKIISEDHTGTDYQKNVFHYPKGIFQQLDLYLSQVEYWYHTNFRLDIEASLNGYHYRIGLHTPDPWFESTYSKTFAGNVETYWGGSLEDGIIQGLTLAVKALAKTEQVQIQVSKKFIKQQFAFMAAVSGKDFEYAGSTKRKLGMPLIKSDVSQIVYEHAIEYYQAKPKDVKDLLEKFRVEEDD